MPLQSTRGAGSAKGFGFTAGGNPFICATGGTITESGDYRIHTFTGPGSFVVTKAGSPVNAKVDYLVVAGGGGGTDDNSSGGGGAGGYRESVPSPAAWTASPIANPGGALPVSATTYPITVGGGGPTAGNGNPSTFSTITSTGGGTRGAPGGSGGGGTGPGGAAGSGNTPPVSPSQGFNGGPGNSSSPGWVGGGGGGATQQGITNQFCPFCNSAGPGGAGAGTAINPSPAVGTPGPSGPLRYFAGGGGAGNFWCGPRGSGGTGGGGTGGRLQPSIPATQGTNNTGGGGGGGGGSSSTGAAGGSGIIVIRYKYK